VPYLSASAVVIHYEEALYQIYAPFTPLYPLRRAEKPARYTVCLYVSVQKCVCDNDNRQNESVMCDVM